MVDIKLGSQLMDILLFRGCVFRRNESYKKRNRHTLLNSAMVEMEIKNRTTEILNKFNKS